jgi:hypothetical protein
MKFHDKIEVTLKFRISHTTSNMVVFHKLPEDEIPFIHKPLTMLRIFGVKDHRVSDLHRHFEGSFPAQGTFFTHCKIYGRDSEDPDLIISRPWQTTTDHGTTRIHLSQYLQASRPSPMGDHDSLFISWKITP